MKLEIIEVFDKLDEYIREMEKSHSDTKSLWERFAVEPYWESISRYAPFDIASRKPEPIEDIELLKKQIELMRRMDIKGMVERFTETVKLLPDYDDDPIIIALYPLSDKNRIVKENQNGVCGANVFGNIVLNINPLARDFEKWIPYVFAHEYHHSVWGNYWYGTQGGTSGTLLEAMLIDGQADSFACMVNPGLNPKWISHIEKTEEIHLWDTHYEDRLDYKDFDYAMYMFGDKNLGIPWCAGYHFGHRIVEELKRNNPTFETRDIIQMSPEVIWSGSGYQCKKEIAGTSK